MSYRVTLDTVSKEIGSSELTPERLPALLSIASLGFAPVPHEEIRDRVVKAVVALPILESLEEKLRSEHETPMAQEDAHRTVDLWGRLKSVRLLLEEVLDLLVVPNTSQVEVSRKLSSVIFGISEVKSLLLTEAGAARCATKIAPLLDGITI